MASSEFPLHLLQSAEQVQLLNDIDKLRSDGVQYYDISLPQLVVCGDQSSGKSSVLEALSNVKFPIDKGTCTRFALEFALRRSPDRKTSAKIIPGKNASADRQQRLSDFQPSDVGLAGVPELPGLLRWKVKYKFIDWKTIERLNGHGSSTDQYQAAAREYLKSKT